MADDHAAPPSQLIIFDTTLRDGEQSPGASMNLAEKLEVAHALQDLGVDVIEAGFPIASPGDFEAVQAIARQVAGPDHLRPGPLQRRRHRPRLGGARATPPGRASTSSWPPAPSIASSSSRWPRTRSSAAPSRACSGPRPYCDDVEFSPEDAARTELDFLAEVVERAIEAGATTVNIPDTVGYAVPSQYAAAIAHLKKHVRGIDKVVLSVHCHNDLGLAVANSLAAVQEGARQIECTINGIGERAGNCALEEIVMAVRTRKDYFSLNTGINTRKLYPTSRLVSHVTGIQVQRNKAIVGQNAFAHEAGIHQDGMLKERSTYEIMNPEDVGLPQTELVLGKHSGRHALRQRVLDLGYHLDDEQLQKVFEAFKVLADRKKKIYDADIEALAEAQIHMRGDAARRLDAGGGHLQRRLGDDPVGRGLSVAPGRHDPPRGQPRRRPGRRGVQGHRAHHRRRGDAARLPRPQRDGRRGRPGRGPHRGRLQRPQPSPAGPSAPTSSRPARWRSCRSSTASCRARRPANASGRRRIRRRSRCRREPAVRSKEDARPMPPRRRLVRDGR